MRSLGVLDAKWFAGAVPLDDGRRAAGSVARHAALDFTQPPMASTAARWEDGSLGRCSDAGASPTSQLRRMAAADPLLGGRVCAHAHEALPDARRPD